MTRTPARYRIDQNNSKSSKYVTVKEHELRQLDVLILCPIIEIDGDCICTWVYDHNTGMNRLKFIHKACPAYSFHERLTK